MADLLLGLIPLTHRRDKIKPSPRFALMNCRLEKSPGPPESIMQTNLRRVGARNYAAGRLMKTDA
jgi:hypothetical protein